MLKALITLFLLLSLITSKGTKAEIKSSSVDIVVKTVGEQTLNRETTLVSPKPLTLNATQSSKIYVNIKLSFSSKVQPELVAGRLIHSSYNNITHPVIGVENKGTGRFQLKFDIGDPSIIQPINGKYDLEIIVAGNEQLQSTRVKIATFNIVFLKSSANPHPSDLHYEPKQEIIFRLDGARQDPQSTFTLFVVFLVVVSFGGFLYSLSHLKVNLGLFPTGGLGVILNLVFLGLIGVIVFSLIKFWISWTFIETVKVLAVLVVPTVVVGNYAILNLSK